MIHSIHPRKSQKPCNGLTGAIPAVDQRGARVGRPPCYPGAAFLSTVTRKSTITSYRIPKRLFALLYLFGYYETRTGGQAHFAMSDLKVLCCTANVGNTQMDEATMSHWVPPEGWSEPARCCLVDCAAAAPRAWCYRGTSCTRALGLLPAAVAQAGGSGGSGWL